MVAREILPSFAGILSAIVFSAWLMNRFRPTIFDIIVAMFGYPLTVTVMIWFFVVFIMFISRNYFLKEQLRSLLDRDPFVPFKIMMTGGQQFEVFEPQQIALGQSQITVYVPKSDKNHILRLNEIAAFHVVQTA